MLKTVQNLDPKKATQQRDIPFSIVQENKFLSQMFNFYIDNNAFSKGPN